MKEDVEISLATNDDVQELACLFEQEGMIHRAAMAGFYKQSEDENEYLKKVNKRFADAHNVILKAVCNGKICGFLCMYVPTPDQALDYLIYPLMASVTDICVDEQYRRRGIGKMLMHAAEELLREKGISAMELYVYQFNEGAKSFYDSEGFQPLDLRMYKAL